jgi:hypothetical protein
MQTVNAMRELSHEMSERILKDLDLDERHELFRMMSLVKQNLVAIKRR